MSEKKVRGKTHVIGYLSHWLNVKWEKGIERRREKKRY